MNIQNTALAVSSAITVVLADGDDHAGALPHVWRFFAFIDAVKAGEATLSVRGISRRLVLAASVDSVALYNQTGHSSAIATYPFPQCGADKHLKNKLEVLLTHTHTTKTQEDMWKHTHKKYEDANGELYCPARARQQSRRRAAACRRSGRAGARPCRVDAHALRAVAGRP